MPISCSTVYRILKRFLALAEFANNLVATVSNPDLQQDLFVKLTLADNLEEAEQYLLRFQATCLDA